MSFSKFKLLYLTKRLFKFSIVILLSISQTKLSLLVKLTVRLFTILTGVLYLKDLEFSTFEGVLQFVACSGIKTNLKKFSICPFM